MMRSVFLAGDGRLRLGLRLLVVLAIFLATLVVVAVGDELGVPAVLSNAVGAVLRIGGLLWLMSLMRRKVDRRPWAGMALSSLRGRTGDALAGFALGAVMILIAFGIERAAGWVTIASTELAVASAL
jgi:hypothetical protein